MKLGMETKQLEDLEEFMAEKIEIDYKSGVHII